MAGLRIPISFIYNPAGINALKQNVLGTLTELARVGFGELVESIQMADEAISTERTFLNLSGGAELATENIKALGRATRDLISVTDQQKIANQLLGMEIVSTSDELEKVVGVSRRLGSVFRNLGAEEAANEFALMISNMSFQRLDTFGISSGNVRRRVKEMAEEAGRAANQQDFFTATMEEADRVLSRLGPEIESNADKMARLSASWANFQGEFGQLVLTMADTGVFDGINTLLEKLTEGAEGWQKFLDTWQVVKIALDEMTDAGNEASGGWLDFVESIPGAGALLRFGEFVGAATFRTEEFKDEIDKANEKLEEQRRREDEARQAIHETTTALAEQTDQLAELSEARSVFARDLIRIDEQTQNDIQETWEDYFEDEQDNWENHLDQIERLQNRHAKTLVKIDKDLQKDLSKVTKDENKRIEILKQDAAKQTERQEKIRRIDHLADERLFNFEMQQLAAEGQGNAIRAAIERRAIEEEIAKEKAAVEGQIEDDKLQDEIERVRTGAEERRRELQDEAVEEKQLREQELAEQLIAEEENYQERLDELRQYRQERLSEIEAGRREAIAELGRELAEAGDLTRSELQALVPVAGQFGEEAGKAYAEGMMLGFQTNQKISQLLGQSSSATTGSGGFNPLQAGPESPSSFGIPGFQLGGIVPGPIGSPQLAVVHGGETITPPGQGININVNGIGGNELASLLRQKIQEGLQEYQDTVLVPLLA